MAEQPMKYYQEPVHVVGTTIFLTVLNIVLISLRFRVRSLQKLPLGLDDWIMIPALIMTMLLGIDIGYGVSRKALAYRTEVPPGSTGDLTFEVITDQILLSFKIGYMFNITFVLAIGFVKSSILLFYLRLFSIKNGKVRVILITLIIIVVMWTVAWLFESIFNCKLNFWAVQGTSQDLKNKCVDFSAADLTLCITDFVIDVAIIIFPIPLIWNLNASTRRKIATSGVFLLGIGTIATSLVRVVVVSKIVAIGLATDSDQVLTITAYVYWGMVETGIGILVACLPTLAFLFKDITFKSIMTATKRLFCKVHLNSTSLDNDSIQAQSLSNDIYQKKTSISTKSNLSSRPWMLATSGDDPMLDQDSYAMKDIINARESV
ncbi:uncharacterized protein GGS22DRAFT_155443 [Annulohypoxylon maeteangense]|uniref:uncharacterized protein n=1 Tax=Annulohypoxylon maeteangense TaxID=1927788 RepID=UPI002007AE7E|nr:uncharacterized protein GGS22DRAFT_155443 [Annulohypoxylon maeteangense]KAI0888264.1 hypothetical protein GGS22DRAFT_155443 [Annulohypoxylon maeteangense]